MTSFDDMPFNDVVAMYNEKRKAIKQGNLNELNVLKSRCPELFIPAIRFMLDYIKAFRENPRYKELCREETKSKLSIIKIQK